MSNQNTQVYMRTAGHTRISETAEIWQERAVTAQVYEQNPAQATVHGLSQTTLYWPQRTITAVANGQIESTAENFHVTISLNITMDKQPYISKHWLKTIPRQLL